MLIKFLLTLLLFECSVAFPSELTHSVTFSNQNPLTMQTSEMELMGGHLIYYVPTII
jgi:hypothetical protein